MSFLKGKILSFNFKTKTYLSLSLVASFAVMVSYQACSPGFESVGKSEFASISSTAPTLLVSNMPSSLSASRAVNLQIGVVTNTYATVSKVECTLDNAAPVNCMNSFTATGLSDGDHTLQVKAFDSFNNSSDVVVVLWKIDATVPVLTINQAPPASTGTTTVAAAFSANEQGTFECALDAQAYVACASPLTLANLSEANHTLKIRAKDLAGNFSLESSLAFRIDLSAPILTLITKPVALSNSTTATFTFAGTDNNVAITVFSCQLDAQPAASCNAGTVTYNNLAAGAHSFSFVGQDSAGNNSAATVYNWSIDLVAPTVPTITANVTTPTKSTMAIFQLNSTDVSGIKSYECQLDTSVAETCAVGQAKTYSGLAAGSHTFKVRAADLAGNLSGFANFNWVIDNVAPTITISQQPGASTTSTSATFAFAAQDAQTSIAMLECQLDAAAYATCTSPANLTGLAVGSHLFSIRATDVATNQVIVSTAWVITSVATPTPTPTPTTTPTDALSRSPFIAVTTLPSNDSNPEWVNGEHRLIKDNSALGSGEVFGFRWVSNDGNRRIYLFSSANNGASWVPVTNKAGMNDAYMVLAITQDSAGRVHAIARSPFALHYIRFSLVYSGKKISDFNIDATITIPSHSYTSAEVRADIKMLKDYAGNELLMYEVNMCVTADRSDITVFMAKATTLTPTTSAQFVGLTGAAGDTRVFDSIAQFKSSPYFSNHIHSTLFAQNGASKDIYLFQGPVDADYGYDSGGNFPDADKITVTKLAASANGWTVVATSTISSNLSNSLSPELMAASSGANYAWIMYVDPVNGIRFGKIDSAGVYNETAIPSPDTSKERNGWGVFSISADETKIWAIWDTMDFSPGGSKNLRAFQGYWNGSVWKTFSDAGASDSMGFGSISGWNNGVCGLLFNGAVGAQTYKQPTASCIWGQ